MNITVAGLGYVGAVAVAALTVYDMVKSAGKGVEISQVRLLEKRGGKSGHWKRTRERKTS